MTRIAEPVLTIALYGFRVENNFMGLQAHYSRYELTAS